MRSALIFLWLVSGAAFGLSLSPMTKDDLVYESFYQTVYTVSNNESKVKYYKVSLMTDYRDESTTLHSFETVVGGNDTKFVEVNVSKILPNKLEAYYVCFQEESKDSTLKVVGRVCAKLRLYFPLAELQSLQ